MTVSMTTADHPLAAVIADVTVAPGGTQATVCGRDVEAASPSKLITTIAAVLYNRIHVGQPEDDSPAPRTLRDPQLDAAFAAAIPHPASRHRAGLHEPPDGDWAVASLEGLRFLVPAAAVPASTQAGGEFTLELPPGRPALSPGFYFADSSSADVGSGQTLRVYLHLDTPDRAIACWGAALSVLEEARVPYRAKVSSSPRLFPRRDGMVIYLPQQSRHAVPLVRGAAVAVGLPADISPFCRPIGPGCAIAWEPDDPRPGKAGMSFGQHRCATLANALVTHAVGLTGMSQHQQVEAALLDSGADPAQPWRNIASPPLDL